MLSKYEKSLYFLSNNIHLFRCPICKQSLEFKDNTLRCMNNHVFNINKKGISCLLNNSNLKPSKIYNKFLFENRRSFINNNYYNFLYETIVSYIKKTYKNNKINILDLGCGEGLHSFKILEKLDNYIYFGMDYSKDAINLASDYLSENNFYFIGDVNNLPFTEKQFDVILDILSPYNEKEIKRLLKDDGLFIKVVPGVNYLKELRDGLTMKDYDTNILLEKKFKVYDKIEISDTKEIDEINTKYLINMTPINTSTKKYIKLNNITINLIIYVVKGVNHD